VFDRSTRFVEHPCLFLFLAKHCISWHFRAIPLLFVVSIIEHSAYGYAAAPCGPDLREFFMPTINSFAPAPISKLLLTAKEAARALAISERTLWSLTRNGDIPSVRFGRAVRYDPRDLDRWIERQKQLAGPNGEM